MVQLESLKSLKACFEGHNFLLVFFFFLYLDNKIHDTKVVQQGINIQKKLNLMRVETLPWNAPSIGTVDMCTACIETFLHI